MVREAKFVINVQINNTAKKRIINNLNIAQVIVAKSNTREMKMKLLSAVILLLLLLLQQ